MMLYLHIPETIVFIVIGIIGGGIGLLSFQIPQDSFAKLELASGKEFVLIFFAPIRSTRILVYAFVRNLPSTLVVASMVYHLSPLTGLSTGFRAPSFADCLTFEASSATWTL